MKKTILIVGLVVAALVVFGVGAAFAQGTVPHSGNGPMQTGDGLVHNYVEQALAAKLGITEKQVEDQFAAGKSMYQIALDNGIKQETITEFMDQVHKDAFAKAVKDGVVTQDQANWMLQRMQSRGDYGTGNCPMQNGQGVQFNRGAGMMNGNGRGMMGGGFGRQNQPSNP